MKKYTHFTPRHRGKARLKYFVGLIKEAMTGRKFSEQEKASIKAFMGIQGRCKSMMASDVPLTHQAATYLEEWFVAQRELFPDRNWFFVTIMDDCFNTDDRTPFFRIKAIERKVNNTVRKWCVNAVMRFEIQAEHRYRNGSRPFMVHLHGLLWTDDDFDHLAIMRDLNASPHWTCASGAKPILIQPVGPTLRDARSIAHYIIKLPDSVKNRIETGRRKPKQLDSRVAYRASLALRLLEGYSQVPFQDTVFGIGEGAKCWAHLRSHLRVWHDRRPQPVTVPADYDPWPFWRDLRSTHGTTRFHPWRVDSYALPKPAAVNQGAR